MLVRWSISIILVSIIMYLFPLFHLRNLDEVERNQNHEKFDPEVFVTDFWNNRLLQSIDRAVPVKVLFPLLKLNPEAAQKQYANTVGIGNVYYYFLQGDGYVHSIENNHIAIVFDRQNDEPDLWILTGKIFGNAIRDGTALLDVSDFPNSQEFNQISQALNSMVEKKVLLPFVQKVKKGDRVHFAGCTEIGDETKDLHPIKLIPIFITIH